MEAPNKTLRERVISALKKANCYDSLKNIYKKVGATNSSEKAAVRGVLNHEVGTPNSVFQRKAEVRGKYRYKNPVKKVETEEQVAA